jgi:hypothetical protein
MDRREALKVLGSVAVLPFFTGPADVALRAAAGVHDRLSDSETFRTLNAAQQQLVIALAERILPRTDTPGATDVRVAEFIDLILTEWASEGEQREFLAGLADIENLSYRAGGATFAASDEKTTLEVLRILDGMRNDSAGAGKAFGQLKSLTVYGYFTSERVQREVLKTRMYFTHYDGNAPV